MLKVHVQHIWPRPEDDRLIGPQMAVTYAAQDRLMRQILGPDVELSVRHNARSAYFTSCSSMDAYNVVGLLEGLAAGEAEGCHVALIACGNDPGLVPARDLLSIPVVGITEAALLTACQIGRRFGIVTMDEASVHMVERNLRLSGLEDRAVGVRPVRSPGFYESGVEWFSDAAYLREKIVPRFEETARTLIADGADVIVTACGNYAAFSVHGYGMISGTQVPVIEALATGTHMARMLGDLRRGCGLGTSKHGAFAGVPASMRIMAVASATGREPTGQDATSRTA